MIQQRENKENLRNPKESLKKGSTLVQLLLQILSRSKEGEQYRTKKLMNK